MAGRDPDSTEFIMEMGVSCDEDHKRISGSCMLTPQR